LIFKCSHSKFDRCKRSCGHIQRRLLLAVVLLACLGDKRGLWVRLVRDLGCLGWLSRWIGGGLESHSDSKGFHPSFKHHISVLILLLIRGNSSRRICPFLSGAPFAEESLVFFIRTICHREAITYQTTQKGDAPDNQ